MKEWILIVFTLGINSSPSSMPVKFENYKSCDVAGQTIRLHAVQTSYVCVPDR